MKISEELQLEIQTSRSELNTAIYNHQIWHNKHLIAPENQEFIDKRKAFEVYIRTVAAHQKGVYDRLRQELEKNEGVTPGKVKDCIASMFPNINNNSTTMDNAPTNDDTSGVDAEVVSNGIDNENLDPAKEDYEDNVCNGDIATDETESLEKTRSVSVETLSADDMEVVEVPVGREEGLRKRKRSEEPVKEPEVHSQKKLDFLEYMGLTTVGNAEKIQKKMLQRKTRSNRPKPQFLYSDYEVPTVKKATRRKATKKTAKTTKTDETEKTVKTVNARKTAKTTETVKKTKTTKTPKSTKTSETTKVTKTTKTTQTVKKTETLKTTKTPKTTKTSPTVKTTKTLKTTKTPKTTKTTQTPKAPKPIRAKKCVVSRED